MYEEANDVFRRFLFFFVDFCVFLVALFCVCLPTLCGATFCDALRKRCRKVTALGLVRKKIA